jgi:hypothetical protein
MLISLIYASNAAENFHEHQIPQLLKAIRPQNARHGITGMLLYDRRSFLQILEGESAMVEKLYRHLSSDARHTHVTRIHSEAIETRAFSDWSMDYATVDAPELGSVAAPASFTAVDVQAAKRLLTRFRRPSWQKAAGLTQNATRTG